MFIPKFIIVLWSLTIFESSLGSPRFDPSVDIINGRIDRVVSNSTNVSESNLKILNIPGNPVISIDSTAANNSSSNSTRDDSVDVKKPNKNTDGSDVNFTFINTDNDNKIKSFTDTLSSEGESKVHMCVHKFDNGAHTSHIENDETPISSHAYNDPEYDYYEDKEPILSNVTIHKIGVVRAERCPPQMNFCYALWTENPDNGEINIIGQGCWESSDRHDACKADECSMDRPPSRAGPKAKFCCCKSKFCNISPMPSPISANTVTPVIEYVSSASPTPDVSKSEYRIVIFAVCCIFVFFSSLIYYVFKYFAHHKETNSDGNDSGNNLEAGGPGFSCSTTCVDNLKLHDNIGSGRHAKIWRGSLGGIPVAVKALPASKMSIWARERDLYSLPHMGHPNLLKYFGCDTRPTFDGPPEHLLVLQLAPLGSLRSYLIENTLNWEVYTTMALGIASALAHLHTHVEKDDLYKPCIVHRDVNSSNIFVRADLTCCLGDLGLAMSMPESKVHFAQTNTYRIQEAGTLRYLAPEALEGAVDLRRCAASLRAVDVYALALVLWELLSRCSDLHRAPGPLPYVPPFHAEVGDQPTLEKMQVVVVRHKARPLFSPRLLSIRATRLARDTCEDCWDHDADARLTAVCVVERLNELKGMRPAPSPTINSNDLRPPTQNYDNVLNSHSPGSCEDKNSNVTSSTVCNSNQINLIDFQANAMQKLPLQPHQGRNPCLERNLASVGSDDRLIDKSLKDMTSISPTVLTNNEYGSNTFLRTEHSNIGQNFRHAPQDFSRVEEHTVGLVMYGRNSNRNYINQNSFTVPPLTNQDVNLQVSNHEDPIEFRQIARPVTPIGYVQNDVSSDVNTVNLPNTEGNPYGLPAKKSNVPLETNQSRWGAKKFKNFLSSKFFKKKSVQNKPVPLETEVNLVLSNGKPVNNTHMNSTNGKFKTSVILNDTKNKINKDNTGIQQSDASVDRPSSLPGLDSVLLTGTIPADYQSKENSRFSSDKNEGSASGNKNLNYLGNSMCAISPPNRTISHNMVLKDEDRLRSENVIAGFKELPSFVNDGETSKNVKSPTQVFAVIVPKSSYNTKFTNMERESNLANEQQRNNIESQSQNSSDGSNKKLEVNSDAVRKRHSCDEKFSLTNKNSFNGCAKNEYDKNTLHYNRNSYGGEFEVGNFCKYNKDEDFLDNGSGVDYSSNSEDEHMLLLSENGGSKITMRQRYDVRSSHDSRATKKNKSVSSSHLMQDNGNGLSKMAAESFSSLCNKYGAKSKYENLKNEYTENKNDSPPLVLAKDAPSINHKNKKLRLSICMNSIEDINFIDLNQATNSIDSEDANDSEKTLNSSMKFNLDNDSSSSGEDLTLPHDKLRKNTGSFKPLSIKHNLSRQHSLELVTELFSSSADLTRLKDPASRIKTPGDVPPSVRKMRGSLGATRIRRTESTKETNKVASNRLSLYDDRMMFGNSL